MKNKVLVFLVLLFSLSKVDAQVYYNRTNGLTTPVDPHLGVTLSLKIPVIADTTTALTKAGIDSCGLIFKELLTGKVWIRDTILTGGHKWTQIIGSGGGSDSAFVWGTGTGLLSNQTDLWNVLQGKQSLITLGTTLQYFRGDLSLATFPTTISTFTNDAGYLTSVLDTNSITQSASSKLQLTGDVASPGANQYYGTNGGGTKGWYTLSGATGTVTSIVAGTGLTGGTITSSGTIAVDTSIIHTYNFYNTKYLKYTDTGSLIVTATTNAANVKYSDSTVKFLTPHQYLTTYDSSLVAASGITKSVSGLTQTIKADTSLLATQYYVSQHTGPVNIGSTQNATNYTLTSSTGSGTTLQTATTNLAGLMDTARTRFTDSLKNNLKAINLYTGAGLTFYGGDSIRADTSLLATQYYVSTHGGTDSAVLSGLGMTRSVSGSTITLNADTSYLVTQGTTQNISGTKIFSALSISNSITVTTNGSASIGGGANNLNTVFARNYSSNGGLSFNAATGNTYLFNINAVTKATMLSTGQWQFNVVGTGTTSDSLFTDSAGLMRKLPITSLSLVKYSDTASMLSPYLRSVTAAATYVPLYNLSDRDTITQTAHGFSKLNPVYIDGSGVWHKADTNNLAMAVVIDSTTANTFVVGYSGTYNVANSLTVGSYYYVSEPAGTISTTSPNISQPVLVPLSSTSVLVKLYRPNKFQAFTDSATLAGSGLVKSISGTNITLTADTTLLATQYYVSQHGGGSDSAVLAGLAMLKTTSGTAITLKADTSYLMTQNTTQVSSGNKTFSGTIKLTTGNTYASEPNVVSIDTTNGQLYHAQAQVIDTTGAYQGNQFVYYDTTTGVKHFKVKTASGVDSAVLAGLGMSKSTSGTVITLKADTSYLVTQGTTQTLSGSKNFTSAILENIGSLGTGATVGSGVYLKNPTAAASGAQQNSPLFTLEGQGWKTTATAASQSVDVSQYVLPIQGTANPTGSWKLIGTVNGGTATNMLTVNTDAIPATFSSTGLGFVAATGSGNAQIMNNIGSNTTLNFYAFSMGNGNAWTSTSGTDGQLDLTGSFSPASGTAVMNALAVEPTVNQTGGASGITRGLYIHPTLTAAASWRSIDVASGNSYFGTTSGDVLVGTTADSSALLQVGASTSSLAQLYLNTGTRPTSTKVGMLYRNGDSLNFVTSSGVVNLATGGSGSAFAIKAQADSSAKTAGVSNYVTYTVPAGANHLFQIDAYMYVTAISSDDVYTFVQYTDENNIAQTRYFYPMGASTYNLTVTGPANYSPMGGIVAKAGTTIQVTAGLTNPGGGSVTMDFGATIIQVR